MSKATCARCSYVVDTTRPHVCIPIEFQGKTPPQLEQWIVDYRRMVAERAEAVRLLRCALDHCVGCDACMHTSEFLARVGSVKP